MADIANEFGSDFRLSATGDLAMSAGGIGSRERVLRRILTVPGMYLWHTTYGAGLPAQIGETTSSAIIEAITRQQMLLEPGVAPSPAPTVRVTPIFGGVVVSITYTDAATSQPMQLGFTVER